MHRAIESVLGTSWWVSFAALVVVLLAFAEVGFRLGRRPGVPTRRGADQVSVTLGAILGLLGLLLAFSFGMVETRFSARRALVLDEANAIGTTFLRSKLMPEPHSGRLQELLRDYVDARLSARDPGALETAIERSTHIHGLLWREAEKVAEAAPESEVVSLFLSSLNEVIDLHTSRVTVGLYQRLPPPFFDLLLVVSSLAAIVLGYGSGLVQWRAPIPTLALVVSIAFAVVTIRQIDLPGTRLFEVSPFALEDLRRTMTAH